MFLAMPDEETVELYPRDLPSETAIDATRRRLLEEADGHDALAAEAKKEGRSNDATRHTRAASVLREASRDDCFHLVSQEANIDELELSIRIIRQLSDAGISTVNTLVSLTRADLVDLGILRKSLREIEQALAQHNLSLKG